MTSVLIKQAALRLLGNREAFDLMVSTAEEIEATGVSFNVVIGDALRAVIASPGDHDNPAIDVSKIRIEDDFDHEVVDVYLEFKDEQKLRVAGFDYDEDSNGFAENLSVLLGGVPIEQSEANLGEPPVSIIHVNRGFIASNAKDGGNRPVYTVKTEGVKHARYAREISIKGPSYLVYDGTQLKCGARAWIETSSKVELIDEMAFAEAKALGVKETEDDS